MVLVAQAGTATEAMKEFRLHRPDVALMDLRLPGANGTDALIATRLAEHLADGPARELEILRLIRDGSKNKEIAARLEISEATVNFHIKNVVRKLQANDRTHAVMIAIRRGMLEV